MTLIPTLIEKLARARADLRMGVPIVMTDGFVMFPVETLSDARFAKIATLEGDPVLAITGWRAQTLKVAAYDGDIVRIAIPRDATVTWAQHMADPAGDLHSPMKGPFKTQRNSSAAPHRAAITLAKAARLLPAIIAVAIKDSKGFAAENDLTLISAASVTSADAATLHPLVRARLPLTVSEAGRLHVFRPDDGSQEHYAVEIGDPDRSKPILARLHSACFTGDVLGSLKCDCGPQLHGAMAQMGAEGAGVLLYLNQEGRGIGLANKMRAYSLQDQGFDTVEANHRLGFEDDERDFRIGADILRQMGFKQVRLLTNNPAKVTKLDSCGLTVTERVALKVGETPFNEGYLATKAAKSGHML